jgi:hypothetical protein
VLVTLLALSTFISFTPFATFAANGFLVRLPRTDLEVSMVVGTRAAKERMIGVGESAINAEATRCVNTQRSRNPLMRIVTPRAVFDTLASALDAALDAALGRPLSFASLTGLETGLRDRLGVIGRRGRIKCDLLRRLLSRVLGMYKGA